jgi:hypothetical protein
MIERSSWPAAWLALLLIAVVVIAMALLASCSNPARFRPETLRRRAGMPEMVTSGGLTKMTRDDEKQFELKKATACSSSGGQVVRLPQWQVGAGEA